MTVDTELLLKAISELGFNEILSRVRLYSAGEICRWEGIEIGRKEDVEHELLRLW